MDIVEEFAKFKKDLKEKWVDYYEENKDLIVKFYSGNSCPPDDFIIGVLTLIEPNIKTWISFYLIHVNLHSSAVHYIRFLGLNFDYNEALEMRREKRAKNQLIPPPSPLDDFRQKNQELKNQS